MANIPTLRYVVPPILFIFSLGVGVVTGPNWGYYSELLKRIASIKGLPGTTVAIITAITVVVSLGFLIGALGAVLLRLAGLLRFLPRGMSMWWSDDAKNSLKQLYKFQEEEPAKKEFELAEQCLIAEFYSPHLYGWLRGRWEYYFTNYNCVISILVLFCMAFLPRIDFSYWWWFFNFLFLLGLGFNAWQSFWEVIDMDHFILRNRGKIEGRNHDPLRIW